MGLLQYLGFHSPLQIKVFNMLIRRTKVGEDMLGNRYYRAEPRRGYDRERRWVIYKDKPEASMVPPQWHAWLHHQSNLVPDNDNQSFRRAWQKPHKPNLTGTSGAYRPPGHVLSGGKRAAASGDYEPWTPPE